MSTTIPISRRSKRPALETWKDLKRGESVPVPDGCDWGELTGERSGNAVLDLDDKNGVDGAAELAKHLGVYVNGHRGLEAVQEMIRAGVLPVTKTVRTRSGGLHLHFRHLGEPVQNSASKIAPNVDVRGDGGYVKIPPSEGYSLLWDLPLADPPTWFVEATRKPARALRDPSPGDRVPTTDEARSALVRTATELSSATSGGNELCARLGYTMGGYVGSGSIDFETVLGTLSDVIESAGWDDLDRHRDTLERAIEAGAEEPFVVEAPAAPAPPKPTNSLFPIVVDAASLDVEDPPLEWVHEPLSISPGLVTLLAGYGDSGKSYVALDMVIGVLSGREGFKRGRAVYVDFEQSARITKRRIRKLLAGRQQGKANVPDLAIVRPKIQLDAPGALEAFTELCRGCTVVVVDSLSRAFGGLKENDAADMSKAMGLFNRIAEETGAAIVVIHHARKAKEEDPQGSKFAIRGSGAIFAVVDQAIVLAREASSKPIEVHRVKERERGPTVFPWSLSIDDIGDGVVVHKVETVDAAKDTTARIALAREEVLAFVRANDRCIREDVKKNVTGNKGALIAPAINWLIATGAVFESQDKGTKGKVLSVNETKEST